MYKLQIYINSNVVDYILGSLDSLIIGPKVINFGTYEFTKWEWIKIFQYDNNISEWVFLNQFWRT